MNNWTISEESKKMLAELKPMVESIRLPKKVTRCKYCNDIIAVFNTTKNIYCDYWCEEMARTKLEVRRCTCGNTVEPYLFKTGKRKGEPSGKFHKYCKSCTPPKKTKIVTCIDCDIPVQYYINKTGKRVGQSTGKYPKRCDNCKQKGHESLIKN